MKAILKSVRVLERYREMKESVRFKGEWREEVGEMGKVSRLELRDEVLGAEVIIKHEVKEIHGMRFL